MSNTVKAAVIMMIVIVKKYPGISMSNPSIDNVSLG